MEIESMLERPGVREARLWDRAEWGHSNSEARLLRYANFATTNVRSSLGGAAPRKALADARIASRMASGLWVSAVARNSRNRLSPYSSPAALTASVRPSE